ncbi:MAG TPA: cadherin-like beta sandwich domain-containing protein [Nitrospira sp.]|nr:cadherin-like beta sandwich domain-containing protein [Nitrospira sp.]
MEGTTIYLSALTVSPGSLVPAFSANTLNYTVNVGSDVTNVTVSATKADSSAVLSEDVTAAAGTATGHAPIQLDRPGSNTRITIAVTAPNGAQKTYTVNMSRATLGGSAQSTESFSYLAVGIGFLAAIGAFVYFVVFSQGPSPWIRDEAQHQPTVQSPSASTEVSRPSSVVQQPSTTTQEKPSVKQESTTGGTVAAKPRTIAGSAKTITGKDGAPMVFIPAGEFLVGSPDGDKNAQDDERPVHSVYLDAYYIDQYEVTTARYATFFHEKKRASPEFWSEQVLKQHGEQAGRRSRLERRHCVLCLGRKTTSYRS